MRNLINSLKSRVSLTLDEVSLIEKHFELIDIPTNTIILKSGMVEHYIHFVSSGIVKGYQNIDGKIVVQYLADDNSFFTSLDSFMTETPSLDYFETVVDCRLLRVSKPDFEILRSYNDFWSNLVEIITNEHLNQKIERVQDFQTLTAKGRYLKFIKNNPKLALNVSIENMASFLGMEPQSLSRIRKQVTF
ncbi:MAG: Crp/Fnr family transcriptional regulator [Flavobacteriaceae bacterium]|nr:Crp/Fnr family transcriptional regulator [Flavobacteriaceae bacterium]